MKVFACILFGFWCCSTSAVACDKDAARKVQLMVREMGTWAEQGDRVTFTWGSDWDHTTQRTGLVHAIADSDACLVGRAREINFYRKGGLVAQASPKTGIRLTE